MILQSNYRDLVDSCRDAGLVVEESPNAASGVESASVHRDGWHVGSICGTGSFGRATLCLDLHQNKMSFFVGLFEALETRERNCLRAARLPVRSASADLERIRLWSSSRA